MFDASESEDEVLFIEASTGRERLLRGIITGETADFVLLQRRDGDHEIARKTITKIVRRSGKKGFVARTIDASRAKEESIRQVAFTAGFDAATAPPGGAGQGAGS